MERRAAGFHLIRREWQQEIRLTRRAGTDMRMSEIAR
jgi:hypothetical protein